MAKFMSTHTLPPGAMKREQVGQLAEAAKSDPVIKPYRSFCNLSAGKIMCVMEAPDAKTLAAWFEKMKVPCDGITPVELEGERGAVNDA
jgi:Nickel responsive protein SCO4226-like